MPQSHRIRLRGPWQSESLAGTEPGTRYRRHFHRPSGLEPHESVWLLIEGVVGLRGAALNGRSLPVAGPASSAVDVTAVDITAAMQAYNELVLDVAGDAAAAAPLPSDEIALEIRTHDN